MVGFLLSYHRVCKRNLDLEICVRSGKFNLLRGSRMVSMFFFSEFLGLEFSMGGFRGHTNCFFFPKEKGS